MALTLCMCVSLVTYVQAKETGAVESLPPMLEKVYTDDYNELLVAYNELSAAYDALPNAEFKKLEKLYDSLYEDYARQTETIEPFTKPFGIMFWITMIPACGLMIVAAFLQLASFVWRKFRGGIGRWTDESSDEEGQ